MTLDEFGTLALDILHTLKLSGNQVSVLTVNPETDQKCCLFVTVADESTERLLDFLDAQKEAGRSRPVSEKDL